jgi:hypothetical protein
MLRNGLMALAALGLAVSFATAAGGSTSRSATTTLVVKLNAKNGSGVSGTATVTEHAGHPRIVVTLKRPVRVRGSLPAHLHVGPCTIDPNFNVQSSLTNVVNGSSVTLLKYTTWATFRAGRFSIHVHAPGYTVIACGDVPRSR